MVKDAPKWVPTFKNKIKRLKSYISFTGHFSQLKVGFSCLLKSYISLFWVSNDLNQCTRVRIPVIVKIYLDFMSGLAALLSPAIVQSRVTLWFGFQTPRGCYLSLASGCLKQINSYKQEHFKLIVLQLP